MNAELHRCDSCNAIDLSVRPKERHTNRGARCRQCKRGER